MGRLMVRTARRSSLCWRTRKYWTWKIAAAQEEIDTVVEMNKALIREHAVTGVPQEEFNQKAKSYDERFRKTDAKLNRLKAEKQSRLMRVCGVKKYVENLRGLAGPIEVWDEQA